MSILKISVSDSRRWYTHTSSDVFVCLLLLSVSRSDVHVCLFVFADDDVRSSRHDDVSMARVNFWLPVFVFRTSCCSASLTSIERLGILSWNATKGNQFFEGGRRRSFKESVHHLTLIVILRRIIFHSNLWWRWNDDWNLFFEIWLIFFCTVSIVTSLFILWLKSVSSIINWFERATASWERLYNQSWNNCVLTNVHAEGLLIQLDMEPCNKSVHVSASRKPEVFCL